MNDFNDWFESATGKQPLPWQAALARTSVCENRLIRIPTGMGKTLGVLTTWLFHRLHLNNAEWPSRLVYCLPMRVLVEQTEQTARDLVAQLGLTDEVGVYVLMGGVDSGDWLLHPEKCSILIGTQDMLLSRGLNRGYAAPRARWPMEFGLLNHDALWVLDETQLMGVGLATSSQLQQFREDDCAKALRPCRSWWMSATLQPAWLSSVDTRKMVAELEASQLTVPPAQRTGPLWDGVSKLLSVTSCEGATALAELAITKHAALTGGKHGRITLVVMNRVARASELYEELLKRGRTTENTSLIHSRFRGAERKHWRGQFLSRENCREGVDRIVVATQIVEAGVDISAGCLITDLAPWPNLVQRFGRAARYGGTAQIVVVDQRAADDKAAAPYSKTELDAARAALKQISEVSQASLETFEAGLSDAQRKTLYPYAPAHLLLRKELDELFDTTPDLTGADLDISRFIRGGEDRDCQVFWAEWDGAVPPPTLQPVRDALCAVPVYGSSGLQEWLFNKEKLKEELNGQVFIWDYLDDTWRKPQRRDIYAGRLVLVRPETGGYSVRSGFTGERPTKNEPRVSVVVTTIPTNEEMADAGQDNESLSVADAYQTIATHGAVVANEAVSMARAVGLSDVLARLLSLAGRYHDLGKAHPAFRAQIAAPHAPACPDLAKAPRDAWSGPRPHGLRHELASALALMEMLARVDQDHSALLGGCREYITAGVLTAERTVAGPIPAVLGDELRTLSPEQFNLLVYLVASHHGKVRAGLYACPADQEATADNGAGMPIRGVHDGDHIPPVRILDAQGGQQTIEGLELHLAPALLGLSGRYGASWQERTLALQAQYGPFALAWCEALLRAADIRASQRIQTDPLLENVQ